MTDGDSQYLADRANDAEFSDNRCQFFVKIICENVTMWVVLIKYRIYFFSSLSHFVTGSRNNCSEIDTIRGNHCT